MFIEKFRSKEWNFFCVIVLLENMVLVLYNHSGGWKDVYR